ncbi:hypothetical protein CWS43_09710 [Rahnella sp. AA]|uniref:hypothetical protein n=1 Tax=Rahnella sp. AA TaxID=2057180 RepID=UPI000C34E4E8|nr:hypothetical protein [Rahnella sp. AA]PKE30947.1 hypothetical protein CWS43_09710 [Rahnella sp. AA]
MMPVTADDFLKSALSFEDCRHEMTLRNRVSRAYYGAYLLARDVQIASKIKAPNGRGGVHAQLIDYYRQEMNPEMGSVSQREIAGLLSMAKVLRTKADYKLNILIPASDGSTAVRCAQDVHLIIKNHG